MAVDLLSLLVIWLQGDSSRKLPYPVSSNLSRLLDPLHITLSLKVVSVFSVSFSRPSPLKVWLFFIFRKDRLLVVDKKLFLTYL